MELYQIDLVVMVCLIGSLAAWFTSMLYSFTMAISAIFKDQDWRFYGYAFCGQVLATIVCIIVGFWIMTR